MNIYFDNFGKKYSMFSGRSQRKEYWTFVLINTAIMLILALLWVSNKDTVGTLFFGIFALFALVTIIPQLAITVRRLHDSGHSGWWFFINFVPAIGPLLLLFFMFLGSQVGDNVYGPNPKSVTVPLQ